MSAGPMKQRIFGLENEYGLIFSPNGRIYLPMEKVLGYIFEGLIPNSWPSNAFLVNGARFYQDTGCHPEYSTPECDNILDLVVHDKAGERLLEACLPLGPWLTSNDTFWPSFRVLKPLDWMAEKCTKTSSPVWRVMKP